MGTMRSATVCRKTNETNIQIALSLDGDYVQLEKSILDKNHEKSTSDNKAPVISVQTGIGFLDHMLHALAKHSGWSLAINCKGDLHIDDHHTAEDVCIALGYAFAQALGTPTGLARFGYAY